MSSSRQLVFLPLFLALTGCASTVTIEQEEAAGASLAEQVENQIGLYNDDYLKNYVDAVGRRLVAELGATPYSFRFHVVDQAEPNAFATPGGYIYLSRGIMALVNTEDELAGVLAHEISHVTQRHHAKQASRGVLPGLLTVPGRVVGSVVSEDVGKMINAPIEGAGKVYLSSFSRGQESEADQVGMRLAGQAGYDPSIRIPRPRRASRISKARPPECSGVARRRSPKIRRRFSSGSTGYGGDRTIPPKGSSRVRSSCSQT
jgi:predicted Zn-dependent protease